MEKNVEKFKELLEWHSRYSYEGSYSAEQEVEKELIKMYEELEEKNTWISSDINPPEHGRYLVYCEVRSNLSSRFEIKMAEYIMTTIAGKEIRCWKVSDYGGESSSVKYWMSLPEVPKWEL